MTACDTSQVYKKMNNNDSKIIMTHTKKCMTPAPEKPLYLGEDIAVLLHRQPRRYPSGSYPTICMRGKAGGERFRQTLDGVWIYRPELSDSIALAKAFAEYKTGFRFEQTAKSIHQTASAALIHQSEDRLVSVFIVEDPSGPAVQVRLTPRQHERVRSLSGEWPVEVMFRSSELLGLIRAANLIHPSEEIRVLAAPADKPTWRREYWKRRLASWRQRRRPYGRHCR